MKHRKPHSNELKTAASIMEFLRQQGALVVTPNVNLGQLADVIAVGMGTAKAEEIPTPTTEPTTLSPSVARLLQRR